MLTIGSAFIIADGSAPSSLIVQGGSSLNVNGAINGDGTSGTRFGTIDVEGSLTSGASGYINSSNFTIGNTGIFNVNFNGANQTQSWWFQSIGPDGIFSINEASTINYSASANQNIGALTYGNLSLRSPTASSTKTLQAGNTLNVGGNLLINSSNVTFNSNANSETINIGGNLVDNGTWLPSQIVAFDGVNVQSIGGNSVTSFNGGLRISNTTQVILSNTGIAINGELDIDPGCTFNPDDQDVTVLGNMRVDGTLLAGSDRGFIFNGTTNYFGFGSRNFNDFTITPTGTVTGPANQTLTVAGSFINNGAFNNNNGTINMTGIGGRTIGGTNETVFNLLNVSGGTVSNNNPQVKVSEGITIGSNTTLDADGTGSGTFTLLSIASDETAYVGIIPSSSSITGNVTAQRFFSAGRFYRYLGSPVQNTTVADWQQEFPITGTFADPSTGTFDGIALISDESSLFFWNATTSDYVAYPTIGSAASNLIVSGRGYTPFIRNNSGTIVGAVTGVLNQKVVTLPVAFDTAPPDGNSWNLVANPYAAPINWDAAAWTKTNIANELHVPLTSGGFATYIAGVGNNGGSQYVASGQAFWVRATAASPTLTARENIKSVAEDPTYFRTAPIQQLKIELSHEESKDAIVFALRDEATFGFDEQFDAKRLLNSSDLGYTLSTAAADGAMLKISSIPKSIVGSCSMEIELKFENVIKTGQFEFSFMQLSDILPYYTVSFEDNFTGTRIDLKEDVSYEFEVNQNAQSKASDRFKLILSSEKQLNATFEVNSKDICTSEESAIVNITNAEVGVTYYLLNDTDTLATKIASSSTLDFTIPSANLAIGENVLDIALSNGNCSNALVAEAIEIMVSQVAVIQAIDNLNTCKGQSVELNVSSDIVASSYSLLVDGKVINTSSNGIFNLSPDSTTTYTVIAQNETSCPSNEVVFTAFVSSLDQPNIIPNGNVLETSVEGDSYQWFLEGDLIAGEGKNMLVVSNDGNYQVEVSKSGCTKLSDGYFFQQRVTSTAQKMLNQIQIYPNPVFDEIQLDNTLEEVDLIVFTVEGKFIFEQKLRKGSNKLNMSTLESGIYLIKLSTANGESVTNRIIKD